MSKLTKLIKSPRLFFEDMGKKRQGNQGSNVVAKKKEFSLDDAMAVLAKFEKNYPVSQIKHEENRIWFAIRYGLWMKLWKLSQGSKAFKDFNPYKMSLTKAFSQHYSECHGATHINQLAESKVDFLVISNINSSDLIELNGKQYQRVIDPIYESLLGKFDVAKVAFVREPSERVSDEYYYAPTFIMPDHVSTHRHHEGLNGPMDFFDKATQNMRLIGLNKKHILQIVDEYFNLRAFYVNVLKKYNPSAVVFMNLGIHLPLCDAAKELGIKCVEVQHGAQKANTPIYNDWHNFPKTGYVGLPSHFAVWSEEDSKHISKVFQNTVEPLVIGYPWLKKSKGLSKGTIALLDSCRKKYIALGLITLQNQEFFPEEVRHYVEATNGEICWLIKLHPKWNVADLAEIKALENVVIDDLVQAESVLDLFEKTDVHITRDSSCVYEASFARVPSFVYGNGEDMFSQEIDLNAVYKLDYFEQFIIEDEESIRFLVEEFKEFLHEYSENHSNKLIDEVDLSKLHDLAS